MSTKVPKLFVWAVVAALVLIVGVLAFLSPAPQAGVPITMSFRGYAPGTNGIWIASFCISNHSTVIIDCVGDGPTAPFYSLSGPGPILNGIATGTNYHTKPSVGLTFLKLAPSGTVTFAVPMEGGTNDMSLGIQYLPRENSSLMDLFRQLVGVGKKRIFQHLDVDTPF